jgi:hypothetical protein
MVKLKLINLCYIGQHARTGDYVFLQFKGNVMVGPVIHIAKSEMTRHGLEIVLSRLREGPGEDCVPFSFKD